MALVKSGTLGSGTPLMAYELHAEQTAGSGTKRTIKMTLKAKCNGTTSASYYGYAVDYYFTVNGTKTTTTALKSSARWYGNEAYRTFTSTVTVDVGTTSSKAITVGVTTSSSGGWSGTASGSFTVGSTNTAPVIPTNNAITLKENNSSGRTLVTTTTGVENAVKFGENVGALYLSWTSATDNEGNTITYEIYESVSNGGWTKLGTTTANYYTRSIGSGSSTQGKSYDYYIKAYDSGGLYASGQYNATRVQKNTLTGANASCSTTIGYSTTSFDVNISGASNTIGNTTFTYYIYSNDIPIYNQAWLSSTTQNIKIWRTGETVPTTPYIKFDELKTLLASSNYKKSVTFYVQTKNAFGSIVTKSFTISFNIQTNPTSFSFGSIDGHSIVNGSNYFIPSEKAFTLTWGASLDNLGNAIKYDVYYSYDDDDGSNFNLISGNLTTNKFTGSFPSVSSATKVKFKIVAKTTYGTSTSTTSGTYTFHYVGVPTVKLSLVRNQSSYTITGTITVKNSLSLNTIHSVKYTCNGVTTQTNATLSGTTFTLTRNLAEGSTDNVTFYVLDKANNDLGKSATTVTQAIGRYNPMFSIREKGVGVNCIPSGDYTLKINGTTYTSGEMSSGSYVRVHSNNNTATLGAGSGDVYIHNRTSNKYLQMGNTGTLTYSGQKIFFEGNAPSSGNWWSGTAPMVRANDGGMEIGQFIDFHKTSDTTADFDARIGLDNSKNFYFTKDVFINNDSSGIKGHLWSGTGGFVVQGEAGANLHLGANNSSEDMIIYGETGQTRRVQVNIETHSKGKIYNENNYHGKANTGFIADTGYVILRSADNQQIYLQGSEARVVAPLTTGTYRPIYASAFTQSSTGTSKTKIKQVSDDDRIDTMQLLKDTNVFTYHLTDEVERGYYYNKKIGFIAEATPKELKAEGEQAIDLYSMTSTLWDVCKQQQETIESQQKQIDELMEVVNLLCE